MRNGKLSLSRCLSLGLWCALAASSSAGSAAAQASSIDAALAAKYFAEAEAVCARDRGRLWGVALCGPVLFIDPATRDVTANRADAKGLLTKRGDVFVGKLPDEETCANTATDWAGVRWTMLLWPLPEDERARARLLTHELFHRVQDGLGLPAANPTNDHLDTRDGRLWLQLEWRALRAALLGEGAARRRALADALVFRAHRRALFPGAAVSERALEMNEGLAEYTGSKLTAPTDALAATQVAGQIEAAPGRPTFVRSFAYVSGPAYGLLLDAAGADWRRGLKPVDDLGELLRKALSLTPPRNLRGHAEQSAARYEGAALRRAEDERESVRRKRVAVYRARFVEGPTLLLPLGEQVQYSFNPNNLVPLEGTGTVYPTLTVSEEWGVLNVSEGALMTREGGKVSKVYVPSPTDLQARPLKGDGWTLQLNEGWKLEPAGREGSYVLKRAAASASASPL